MLWSPCMGASQCLQRGLGSPLNTATPNASMGMRSRQSLEGQCLRRSPLEAGSSLLGIQSERQLTAVGVAQPSESHVEASVYSEQTVVPFQLSVRLTEAVRLTEVANHQLTEQLTESVEQDGSVGASCNGRESCACAPAADRRISTKSRLQSCKKAHRSFQHVPICGHQAVFHITVVPSVRQSVFTVIVSMMMQGGANAMPEPILLKS